MSLVRLRNFADKPNRNRNEVHGYPGLLDVGRVAASRPGG